MFLQKKMMKFEGLILCHKYGEVKLYTNEKQAVESAKKNEGKVFPLRKETKRGVKYAYYVVK